MFTASQRRQTDAPRKSLRAQKLSMAIESLEDRRLMSASLANGVLSVVGRDSDTAGDYIAVVTTADPSQLMLNDNGVVSYYSASSINKVVINGLRGNDRLMLSNSVAKPAEIYGGLGNDTIAGGAAGDYLSGGGGTDSINGNDGNDILDGGVGGWWDLAQNDGNDSLAGGAGNDVLYASDYGNNVLRGGDGNDQLNGYAGNDFLDGEAGRDNLSGYTGNDTLVGSVGEDLLSGGAGDDTLRVAFNFNTFIQNRGQGIVPANEYSSLASGQDILDLKLDLGSTIRNVLKPAVSQLQSITRGLQPVVNLYRQQIPLISKLDSSLTWGKVLDSSGRLAPFINAISNINSLNIVEQDGLVDFGQFAVSSTGVTRTSLANPFQYLGAVTSTLSSLDSLGVSFPVLKDPTSAAQIALGRNVDLISYTLPSIDIAPPVFSARAPIWGVTIPDYVPLIGGKSVGIIATLDAKVRFQASGTVGMDLTGVRSGNILDGFYATSNTGASISLNITGGVKAEAEVVSVGLTGLLGGTVSATLRDLNGDGKVRISEMTSGSSPFTFSAGINYSASVWGKAEIPGITTSVPVPGWSGWHPTVSWKTVTIGGWSWSDSYTFASGKFSLV